jgi:hypothetical protein
MYKSFDFLNFEVHYISEWNENNYYKNITTFYIHIKEYILNITSFNRSKFEV